ncbi:hypothetical protein A2803_01570 [Candidatus Woesebacteria bacterium RIFCSPHIGHO2_01_FULL_44_21]|uniref:Uncharacterized protein n=1 Tax=Candidatus Woesebacteria bacterium RIFCSPHIGHO2_01_FULL_44_21 TaxID=1802503 RepID=A0A1F7YXG1_9BACT|nr:MAG: hypothetical protein A2803_01570 [Candidatus Woesebacteria bacterium RIFCSPHIGHO2_01_FULL_44_21]OGM69562.1 MAG: hypothetical protein A2897_03085 [Candidatus Woesebacteria bacterium RIFCSPLOWO2_01_FULL_44_24b]
MTAEHNLQLHGVNFGVNHGQQITKEDVKRLQRDEPNVLITGWYFKDGPRFIFWGYRAFFSKPAWEELKEIYKIKFYPEMSQYDQTPEDKIKYTLNRKVQPVKEADRPSINIIEPREQPFIEILGFQHIEFRYELKTQTLEDFQEIIVNLYPE